MMLFKICSVWKYGNRLVVADVVIYKRTLVVEVCMSITVKISRCLKIGSLWAT